MRTITVKISISAFILLITLQTLNGFEEFKAEFIPVVNELGYEHNYLCIYQYRNNEYVPVDSVLIFNYYRFFDYTIKDRYLYLVSVYCCIYGNEGDYILSISKSVLPGNSDSTIKFFRHNLKYFDSCFCTFQDNSATIICDSVYTVDLNEMKLKKE